MIEIHNVNTFGWRNAILGMRNSWESWDKSDSDFDEYEGEVYFRIGNEDLKLASQLAKAGGSEAKFRRMIHIQCTITAPIYWWKQFDTYKVGTTALSTSTMHTITNRDLTVDDFSHTNNGIMSVQAGMSLMNTVNTLNELRKLYLDEKNPGFKKMYWYDIIQLLPESYNQLRIVDMNYEVVAHMIQDRRHHKLDEWKEFCKVMLKELPYSKELIFDEGDDEQQS